MVGDLRFQRAGKMGWGPLRRMQSCAANCKSLSNTSKWLCQMELAATNDANHSLFATARRKARIGIAELNRALLARHLVCGKALCGMKRNESANSTLPGAAGAAECFTTCGAGAGWGLAFAGSVARGVTSESQDKMRK